MALEIYRVPSDTQAGSMSSEVAQPRQHAAPSKVAVTVLILTFNEEKHLSRAIQSVQPFAQQIIVVDSYSADRTLEIALSMGAEILQHPWEHNHSRQFNWALENAAIAGDWVMRLDADEYVTPALAREITTRLPRVANAVTGIHFKRRVHFLGRWLRWGSVYPIWVLRLWRAGRARCEIRWMDEHIRILEGESIHFDNDIVDENLNDLAWWTAKHIGYSRREATDLLNIKYHFAEYDGLGADTGVQQTKIRRRLKEKIYSRLPLFFRPFLYFVYRYCFRFGFLDGVPGLVWHVLQGFWYRFIIDANIYEIEQRARQQNRGVAELIERDWQLK